MTTESNSLLLVSVAVVFGLLSAGPLVWLMAESAGLALNIWAGLGVLLWYCDGVISSNGKDAVQEFISHVDAVGDRISGHRKMVVRSGDAGRLSISEVSGKLSMSETGGDLTMKGVR